MYDMHPLARQCITLSCKFECRQSGDDEERDSIDEARAVVHSQTSTGVIDVRKINQVTAAT
jgi:hypothetical protein